MGIGDRDGFGGTFNRFKFAFAINKRDFFNGHIHRRFPRRRGGGVGSIITNEG